MRPKTAKQWKQTVNITIDPKTWADAKRIIHKSGQSVSSVVEGQLNLLIAGAKARKHTNTTK